jgi:predicted N-acetyltransferase YhbS
MILPSEPLVGDSDFAALGLGPLSSSGQMQARAVGQRLCSPTVPIRSVLGQTYSTRAAGGSPALT